MPRPKAVEGRKARAKAIVERVGDTSRGDVARICASSSVRELNGDPVVAEYRTYFNNTDKHVMILQYPCRNRDNPYSEASGQKPIQVRIKPKSGYVEVDIPVHISNNYDKEKGIEYGEAMRKSKVLQEGGSYGVAGGLGTAAHRRSSRSEPNESSESSQDETESSQEDLPEGSAHSDNKGHAMNKITFSGFIMIRESTEPFFCVGAFRDDEMHLTPVDAIVQLRPKLDHVDAFNDIAKYGAKFQSGADNPTEETEARAVNVAIKSSEGEELGKSDVAKILKQVQEEPWQRFNYVDSETAQAWEAYHANLFHQDPKNAPKLFTTINNQQWLDALSAPRIDPTRPPRQMMSRPTPDDEPSDVESSEVTEEEEEEEEEEEDVGEDDENDEG